MTDGPTVFAGTLAVLLVATGAVLGLAGTPSPPTPAAPDDADVETTADGVRYVVPPRELRQGCAGGMDCIPSIDEPRFQPADEAPWLAPDDQVIGLEVGGEARAYPLRILNVHEVVNDEVAGRPVAVTYCPLCRSGLVFSRRVGGRTIDFGVSGKLLDANLVLYDRQTETYWSQLDARAVVGPLVPAELTILPSTITTWERWRAGHPDTVVLSRDTGIYPRSTYASNPYAGYANSSRVGFGVGPVDDRLPSKALVYGVTVGGASTAYPAAAVVERGVVNDRVGDVPVAVVEDPRDGAVAAFIRRVDNETVVLSVEDGTLVDGEGHRWSFDGEALEGPHRGARLDRLPTHGFFWFAWSEFHPETGVYRAADTAGAANG